MSDFNARALDLARKVLTDQKFDRGALFSAARYIERELRREDEFATCVPVLVDNPGPGDVFRLGVDRAPESLKEFAGQTESLLVEFSLTVTSEKMSLNFIGWTNMTAKGQ